jgi:hypothetical protein
VDVNFGSVYGFAAEILVHLLGMDSLVIDLRLFVNVKAVCVACDSLEEGRATTTQLCELLSFSIHQLYVPARRPEDDKHFSAVHYSIQMLQNINLARLSETNKLLCETCYLEDNVALVS